MRKLKLILISIAALIAIAICVFIYFSLSDVNTLISTVFLFAALSIVILASFLLLRDIFISKSAETKASESFIESLNKVFKVVTAEGHFVEIIDFKHSKVTLPLLSSTKKALIVVKSKVLMGYDMEKLEWERELKNKKLTLKSVPKPTIISLSPEITYYNLENGIFNKFDNEDLNKIQTECIDLIQEKALNSELPRIASKQVSVLLTELADLEGWQLNGLNLLEAHSE